MFYITNIRLVWHANMNESFNVSIPYLQMVSYGSLEKKQQLYILKAFMLIHLEEAEKLMKF